MANKNGFSLYKRYYLEDVALARFIPNPAQPTWMRSTPEKTVSLMESVLQSRFIAPIEVVFIPNTKEAFGAWKIDRDKVPLNALRQGLLGCVNAHRRLSVAEQIGLSAVDAIAIKLPNADNPAALMTEFIVRQAQLSVDIIQQFAIFGTADSDAERNSLLDGLTDNARNAINAFVELMGLDYAIAESKKGTTHPAIAQIATRFVKVCKKEHGPAITNARLDTVTAKDVLVWMINQKTKRLVQDVMRYFRSNTPAGDAITTNILASVQRGVGCELRDDPSGIKVIVARPKKTPTDTPVNTTNMATLFGT